MPGDQDVGNMQARISVDDSGVNKTMTELNREMKVVQSEFRKASAEVGDYGKSTDGLRIKAESLTKQIEIQQHRVNLLREQHEKVAREKGADARETQNLEARMNNASAALARMQNDLQNTTTELEKQTDAWAKVGNRLDEISNKMQKTGKEMSQAGKDMTMAVTVPLLAVGGAAFKAANDVDNAMATIKTSTGATGEVLKGLEDDFKAVYSSVPTSASVASGAIANLNTLLGTSGLVLQKLARNVLEVSSMMGEDGVANSQAFGQAMQQWEIPAEQAVDVMDELFKVTQDTGIGFGELLRSLNTYGSVMKNAGFTTQETAILMGQMNAAGLAWSRISPGLNASFRRWAAEGKNVKNEFAQTVEAIKNAESSTVALTIATQAFGAEGAQRLTTGIRQGAISLDELGASLEGVDGLIEKTAEQTSTFSDEMRVLKNEVEANIAPIGGPLIKALRDAFSAAQPLIDGVGRLADRFSELDEEQQASIIKWGLVVAAIGPAILVVGKFTTAIGATITAVRTLSTALATLMLNPYVLAFGALVGAVALVTTNINAAKKATDELREAQEELQRVQREGIERHEIEMYEEKIEKLKELRDNYYKLIEAAKESEYATRGYNREALEDAAESLGVTLKELSDNAKAYGIVLDFIDENGKISAVTMTELEQTISRVSKAIADARRETTAELNEMARKIAVQNNEIKTTEELLKVYRTAKHDTDEWAQAQAELSAMFPHLSAEIGVNIDAIEGIIVARQKDIDQSWENIRVKAEEAKAIKQAAVASIEADLYVYAMTDKELYQQRLKQLQDIRAEIDALNALIGASPQDFTTSTREVVTQHREVGDKSSRYENAALDAAYRQLEHKKRLDQLTLEQEIATLEQIKARHVKTAEERMQIDERLHAARKAFASAELNEQYRLLDHRKRMGEITLSDELRILERIKDQYVKSADDRMAMEERLYNIRTQLAQQSKDNEKAMLDDAVRQYQVALEDRLVREELTSEQQFELQKQFHENVIRENEEYLNRVLADEQYTAEQKESIQAQVTEVIRQNINERLTLEKNYYDEVQRQEVESINRFSQGVQAALRQKYEQERRLGEENLRRAISVNDEWRRNTIDSVRSVYDHRIRAAQDAADKEIAELNRVLGAQIQAIQDELAALDQAEKQRTREELDAEDEKKLARLQASLDYERDEHNKTQLQKEINRIMAERDERHRKEQLDDHKEALKEEEKSLRDKLREETDLIKQNANEQRDLLNAERDAEIARINSIADHQKRSLEQSLANHQNHYNQLLAAKAIQAQAEKMIIENQHREILQLMDDFGDDYQLAGQTLGDKVAEGFQIGIDHISQLIADLHAQINAARSAAISAMQDAARASNAASTSTVNNNNAKNVTVNNTFTSPVTSPSDVNRATQQMAQRLTFDL